MASNRCACRPTFSAGVFFLLLALNVGNEKPLLSTAIFVYCLGFAAAIAPFLALTYRHAAARPVQRISGGSSLGVRLHLHRAAHGDAGAASPAMGGRILSVVFAAGSLGGRHFRLLRRQVDRSAFDVAAHQSEEDLGRSGRFARGQRRRRMVCCFTTLCL